jgi:hypothetical protein
MTTTTQQLIDVAAHRVRRARPELADRWNLSTASGLRAAQVELAAGAAERAAGQATVIAVIADLDLVQWVRETCVFAFSMPSAAAEAWRRSFTRTVFLAGNPVNLRDRFTFTHTAPGARLAWCGPSTRDPAVGLRRLLKEFEGAAPAPAVAATTIALPADGTAMHRAPLRRDLYVATDGINLTGALINLNHLLAEAVMDRLVLPGDHLTLRTVPQLTLPPARFAALRVDFDVTEPHTLPEARDALRASAGLTRETWDA